MDAKPFTSRQEPAADPLRLPVEEGQRFICSLSADGRLTIEGMVAPQTGLRRFLLTPLQAAIVRALLAGPLKGATIGHRVGEQSRRGASSKLRILLAALVERGILHCGRDGYSVSPAFLVEAGDMFGVP